MQGCKEGGGLQFIKFNSVTGGQAVRRSGGQAVRRSGGQAVRWSGGQAVRRSGGQAVRRSGGQAVRRSGGQADRRTGGQEIKIAILVEFFSFSLFSFQLIFLCFHHFWRCFRPISNNKATKSKLMVIIIKTR